MQFGHLWDLKTLIISTGVIVTLISTQASAQHAHLKCDRNRRFKDLSHNQQRRIRSGETVLFSEKTDTPFNMTSIFKVVPYPPKHVFGIITSFEEHKDHINGVVGSRVEFQNGQEFFVDYLLNPGFMLPRIGYSVRDYVSKTCDSYLLEINLHESKGFMSPQYIDGYFHIEAFEGGTLISQCLYAVANFKMLASIINHQGEERIRDTIANFEEWARQTFHNSSERAKVERRVDRYFQQ